MNYLEYELEKMLNGFGVIPLILFLIFVALFFMKIVNTKQRLIFLHKTFIDFNTSPDEFYTALRQKIDGANMPSASRAHIVTHREDGITSPRRKYLRVSRRKFVVDICAAPFGSGFFFSYVLLPRISVARKLLHRIPLLGPILSARYSSDTAYGLDVAQSFVDTVHTHFVDTVSEISEAQGGVRLSAHDTTPVMTDLFKR